MRPQHDDDENVLKESPTGRSEQPIAAEIDLSLLKASLAMTPWERMLANDDALNFAESLAEAMKRRNAKSQ
jgi:hypothetical protein